MNNIEASLRALRERIARAAGLAGRDPAGVRLLAVSKRHPVTAIRQARAGGQRDFGENYLQEALEKIEQLRDLDLEWHYIGVLQSNKTALVATHFDWVHTIAREKIARRLSAQRANGMPPLNVCIQVNISGEASKAGIAPAQLPALAHGVASLPGLCLRGLMALPAPTPDPALQRQAFAGLRRLLEQLRGQGLALDTLSMGTSNDLEAAILEGATMVRIGTALFGPRPDGRTT